MAFSSVPRAGRFLWKFSNPRDQRDPSSLVFQRLDSGRGESSVLWGRARDVALQRGAPLFGMETEIQIYCHWRVSTFAHLHKTQWGEFSLFCTLELFAYAHHLFLKDIVNWAVKSFEAGSFFFFSSSCSMMTSPLYSLVQVLFQFFHSSWVHFIIFYFSGKMYFL